MQRCIQHCHSCGLLKYTACKDETHGCVITLQLCLLLLALLLVDCYDCVDKCITIGGKANFCPVCNLLLGPNPYEHNKLKYDFTLDSLVRKVSGASAAALLAPYMWSFWKAADYVHNAFHSYKPCCRECLWRSCYH
jgi:hypothetical protein